MKFANNFLISSFFGTQTLEASSLVLIRLVRQLVLKQVNHQIFLSFDIITQKSRVGKVES